MKNNIKSFTLPDGPVIEVVTLTNRYGASVALSTLGAGVLSIRVPDRDGRLADVVLGYDNLADYSHDGPCAGKIAGRYANRIAAGRLTVDGVLYQLAVNCGPNHLHGGPDGFQNRIWHLEMPATDTVRFTYTSADGEENYPGTLHVSATYHWDDDCVLSLTLEATTDAPTVVNLTNHTYFNLAGHNSGSCLRHKLHMPSCSRYLVTDDTLVPTGQFAPVTDTPMDFTQPRALGQSIRDDFEPLRHGNGYDHCWAVDDYAPGRLSTIAILSDPHSGRCLTITSDQPGAQVYTGNWLTGSPRGKGGYEYRDNDAVAIECQDMPDAPNRPEFPCTLLRPGQTYCRHINYAFSTDSDFMTDH